MAEPSHARERQWTADFEVDVNSRRPVMQFVSQHLGEHAVTREQRGKSQSRRNIRADVDRFIENPCRLSGQQTQDLLDDLCVQLGYCLTPINQGKVENDPPTDPESFAELVMELEGVGAGDPDMFVQVLERVLFAFERASGNAA